MDSTWSSRLDREQFGRSQRSTCSRTIAQHELIGNFINSDRRWPSDWKTEISGTWKRPKSKGSIARELVPRT
jgi:hypothetical protein